MNQRNRLGGWFWAAVAMALLQLGPALAPPNDWSPALRMWNILLLVGWTAVAAYDFGQWRAHAA